MSEWIKIEEESFVRTLDHADGSESGMYLWVHKKGDNWVWDLYNDNGWLNTCSQVWATSQSAQTNGDQTWKMGL